jgi:hypothetical protein
MYKESIPPNCVFPKLHRKKEKSSWERLCDSRNPIAKKKVHEKGFVIAGIPSWKKKKVCEKGFVIARIPSWKKKKVREKGFVIARISSWKKKKVRDKGFMIARIPSWKKKKVRDKGFVIAWIPSWRKRPETTTSCGLKKSHPWRDSHRKKARDNNKLWPKIPPTKGFPPKRPKTATSCGLESHPRRDFHRKSFAWWFRSSECVRSCLQIFL